MSPELLPGQLAPTVDQAGPGPPPRPKLARSQRVDDPRRWATVIPPVLAEQVADSERAVAHELELLTRQLPASADAVFEVAHPHVEEALQRLERVVDEGDEEGSGPLRGSLAAVDGSWGRADGAYRLEKRFRYVIAAVS